jgi:uncharacterized protein (TIGR02118 family)
VIKRLTMWYSRPGLSREEALRHWLEDHAPLVRQVPGVRGYVQDHCVDSPEGGGVPYTGLGEVWFDSFESAAAATRTPEWSAVIEDADTFMDLGTVIAAWAEEHEIVAPDGGAPQKQSPPTATQL